MPRLPDKQHDEVLASMSKLLVVMMHQCKHLNDIVLSMQTTSTTTPDLRSPDAPTRKIVGPPDLPKL
jgi:hypothetical protein